MSPSVPAEGMAPGELEAACEALVRFFSRVKALVFRHGVVPVERRPALVANIFL